MLLLDVGNDIQKFLLKIFFMMKKRNKNSVETTSVVPGQYLGMETKNFLAESDFAMIPLLPKNDAHFQEFKKIITNEKVVFTSSLIADSFDMTLLNHYCDNFELKLKMKLEDDPDINLPDDIMAEYMEVKTSVQLALNRFFSFEVNASKLREVYESVVAEIEKTGLGYYKFEDVSKKLLGGGALIPIPESGDRVKKVDFVIHIIDQNTGVGSICCDRLIQKAFDEYGVEEMWCKSMKKDLEVASFMSEHGMIIRGNKKMGGQLYFMDKKMREAIKNRE